MADKVINLTAVGAMRLFINPDDFFGELAARNITNLYHANSVETSISYFRVMSLLSRQQCETQSLHQSAQWSDDLDKKFGIFDDVFLNISDFHFLFNRANHYGPIAFRINVAKLRDHIRAHPQVGISVTKLLPHKWTDKMDEDEKWLTRVEDVFLHARGTPTQHYVKGTSDIILSGTGPRGLAFDLVERVVIEENPINTSFFNQVSSAFANCLAGHGAKIPLNKRNCRSAKCKCKDWSNVTKLKNEYKYDFGNWASEYESA